MEPVAARDVCRRRRWSRVTVSHVLRWRPRSGDTVSNVSRWHVEWVALSAVCRWHLCSGVAVTDVCR